MKIKPHKRHYNSFGKKRHSWRWGYIENNKRLYIQDKNKSAVIEMAEKIQSRLNNIVCPYSLSLVDSWNLFEKKCRYNISNGRMTTDNFNDYLSIYKNQILKWLGNVDLKSIDRPFIEKFIQSLKDHHLTDDYIRRIFNLLKNIYGIHVPVRIKNNIFISSHFFEKHKNGNGKKTKINFDVWSFDRIQQIIQSMTIAMIRLMFRIMAEIACRPSEARAISRSNLKFGSNTPYLEITHSLSKTKKIKPPKTENGYREIEIGSSLKDALMFYIHKIPQDQEYLFLNTRGNFIDLSQMTDQLNQALQSLNLTLPVDRKCYFFRHWTCSYWAWTSKYNNPKDLADAMGDKDINFINENYIKLYGRKPDSHKYSEYQSKHFNWK
jgi:integrase